MIRNWWVGIVSVVWALASCGGPPSSPTALPTPAPQAFTATPSATGAPSATLPPPTITPTPIPLAFIINGEPIAQAVYAEELARCHAGQTKLDCPAAARQYLIDQALAGQAAQHAGLSVTDAQVEARLTQITDSLGGAAALDQWRTTNFYTADSFRAALRRDLLQAQWVAHLAEAIGPTAEQVRARVILVADDATAQTLLTQLKNGADFTDLAVNYSLDLSSRPAGGDLGWFARGILTEPAVETAAFALQPGERSGVVTGTLGYYIIETLEHDLAHPLTSSAIQYLREQAYTVWLNQARSMAHLAPP
jgi:hypothetical protein